MRVIFTNGCFDILHRGHIELLNHCSELGDKVVVGLNSDASIKRIKGSSRPINSQKDRMYMLLALKYVDEVIIFNDDTPYNVIKLLKPDIIVKGGDYEQQDVIGNDIAKVKIFNYVNGYSTTKIIADLIDR
jgi:D-beta-D-heptose 7-phosphate kinase/D-beta-D-heptose 1-phosphate adenosyltransferase